MEKVISDKEKIEKLIDYYKKSGLLIVGLNDSQGVNITSSFFKKGLLEYLAYALTSDELKPVVIDAFSLTMNKTEHIDSFLKHDLTLEEIRLSQIYSVVSAFEKVMSDIGLPKVLGQAGQAYRIIYTPETGDEKIRIATSLREASKPVLVYSSGVNDMMRAVGADPFGIMADYKARDKKPNYYYTLEKATDPKTLQTVIDSIEKNFEAILGINDGTDIYTLGAYVPKSLRSEEMNLFRELVIAYNEALYKLCKAYGITFVDTEEVGRKYNNSESNFHISTEGHNALAGFILGHMYHKIFEEEPTKREVTSITEITGKGSLGFIEDTQLEYEKSLDRADSLSGYARERELAIADEHRRESEVFQKVLVKKTK